MVANESKYFNSKISDLRNYLDGWHSGQYREYRRNSRMRRGKSKPLLDMSVIYPG